VGLTTDLIVGTESTVVAQYRKAERTSHQIPASTPRAIRSTSVPVKLRYVVPKETVACVKLYPLPNSRMIVSMNDLVLR
jgi:hypothetical protein